MSFQAYLDTIKAKTGKTPEDFRVLAAEKGLTKTGEIVAWLKAEFGLGHGHANAIAAVLLRAEEHQAPAEDKVAALFAGPKAHWRPAYDALAEQLVAFGPDVVLAPNLTYINLLRGKKKFGLLQVAAGERLDLGLKLKGVAPAGRLEPAGAWNAMVTHRVRISAPEQLDAEVLAWLRQAYDEVSV